MEKSLAQPRAQRDAEREQDCMGRTDKMTGIVKKIDAQGFGIIDGADGSKVPFIPSDVKNRHVLEPGQKVIFSVRRVKDQAFAENVIVMGERHNW
jgi:cold shock CspA family protein